jgi:hypothetical protein
MLSRFGGTHRRYFRLLPCAIVLLSAGCIAFPVRMSPELLGQPGVSADHTFIKVGQTSRDEVLRSLGWTDTGMRESRLFWGTWKASTSGTVVVFAFAWSRQSVPPSSSFSRGRVSGKYTLRFKTSTAWGKSIDVSVNPPYLLALIRQVGLARG